MNTALWIVQGLLALLYVMAGLWKIVGKGPSLEGTMPGVPLLVIREIGLAEAAAALALVLPAAMPGAMALAGWAGAFLAVEAVVFIVYHIRRRAYGPAGATLVLGILAAFVAWGRLG